MVLFSYVGHIEDQDLTETTEKWLVVTVSNGTGTICSTCNLRAVIKYYSDLDLKITRR